MEWFNNEHGHKPQVNSAMHDELVIGETTEPMYHQDYNNMVGGTLTSDI